MARVDEWFSKNDADWPDDPPALDLEAYMNLPVEGRFVLYHDLSEHLDSYIQMRLDRNLIHIDSAGHVPKKSRKGLLSGYVTDIGDVDTPPADWNDLVASTSAPTKIRTAMQRDRLDVLLVQYHRGTHTGVLAITFKPTEPGGPPRPHLAFSGATDDAAMRLRSGATANSLEDKHVYIVGVGALGSHIADGLSRAGIGHLTVRDHDIYKPGNATRHLVTTTALAGTFKATAVKAVLDTRPYNRANVTSSIDPLTSPVEAATLLLSDALLVDATADDSVTCLFEEAATELGRRFVTTCVQNEGRTLRVDIVPPLDGAAPQPATTLQPPRAPEVFEAGCGVPISPTAPHAVTEAAAIAVRHIIGLLTDRPLDTAGELRELP
ncbi:ThiF family adenylyltransferase [Knoellia sp. Soil729]|uniref:ThiF family adenylyltransferase n=1 Tax=Knoellia sp. Soil729 TaxID=1736394 RepID=UPI00138F72B9|nr:ThiF family adenylyltransferase [Knoellia sp. Soil729]